MVPLCVPLLVSSVRKTNSAAIAAEVRGFELRTRTSGYKEYPFAPADVMALVICCALVAVGVVLQIRSQTQRQGKGGELIGISALSEWPLPGAPLRAACNGTLCSLVISPRGREPQTVGTILAPKTQKVRLPEAAKHIPSLNAGLLSVVGPRMRRGLQPLL